MIRALFIVLLVQVSGAAQADELLEKVATVININGFLCAEVTSVSPLAQQNVYEVTCIEYRGGNGTVRYIMNATTGVVFKS